MEKILDNSRRLAKLSSSILMLSKLENQEMLVDQKEFYLDEQIRQAILMLESKWTAKNIGFDIDLPQQRYFGSEQLLLRVWSNIIDNAVKFSPQGGIIKIDMKTGETELAVSISDSGIGMTEEILPVKPRAADWGLRLSIRSQSCAAALFPLKALPARGRNLP